MIVRFVVGRLSRNFAVAREFEKRLPKYCRLEVFELKDSAKASDFLPKLKGYIIGLDASGVQFSSEQLADFLKKQSDVTFVIGTPQGLPVEIKQKCDMLLSLSRMTFPHDLARVVLAEQVYRAFTILKNEKYHK
jgi:23S rRNA (pseudouridine1915-N3)-methyltransferase